MRVRDLPLVFLACLSLALSPGANAGATETGEITLTTEEAVAEALSNNLRLQSLDTQADIQAHLARSRQWLDNPEIRVRNLSTRKRNGRFDEMEVGLRWRPPSPGEARARTQRADVRHWERRVEASRERAWLASRVRRACADVIMQRELVRIDSARVGNETRRIAQIETMVELGRRSIVYFTKAKMAVTEARNAQAQDLQALREEERRLQRLTGLSSKVDVVVEPLPQIDMDTDELLALAYANRPEVNLVEARKQLAVDEHARERRRLLPWPSFLEVSRHIERQADDWHELVFGVDLPLFNRNSESMAAARLAISRNELQSLAIRERIEDEVQESYSAYTGAMLAWELARREGEAIIGDASVVIAEALAHRTVPADEILELERTIMDARVSMAQRRRELAHALYYVYYAVGIDGAGTLTTDATGDGN